MERNFRGRARKDWNGTGELNGRFHDVEWRSDLPIPRSSSRMLAFDGARRSFAGAQPQQKPSVGGYVIQSPQFSTQQYWTNRSTNNQHNSNTDARAFALPQHYTVPNTSSNSFYKGYVPVNGSVQPVIATGMPPLVAVPASHVSVPRMTNKPVPDQMTIFYGGRVDVFDNIPADVAQKIMFLATNSSRIYLKAPHMDSRQPSLMTVDKVVENIVLDMNKPPQDIDEDTSLPDPPSPESVTSHSVTFPDREFCKSGDVSHLKVAGSSSTDHTVPSGDLPMSRAVPMSRKASLLRFLERRKERICSTAPYVSGKKAVRIGAATDEAENSRDSLESTSIHSHAVNLCRCLGMQGSTHYAVRSA